MMSVALASFSTATTARSEPLRVMVVDDQSPDGTGALADQLALQNPGRIEVMHRSGRRGLGRSYIDGIQKAIAEPVDVLCQMDADLSHDPAHLPDLIAATAHADVVIGSRYIPGGDIVNWPKRRRLLSRFANIYIRAVTRLGPRDCTSGYRCWRRTALAALPLEQFISDGYSFLVEMLFVASRRGCRSCCGRIPGASRCGRPSSSGSGRCPWTPPTNTWARSRPTPVSRRGSGRSRW